MSDQVAERPRATRVHNTILFGGAAIVGIAAALTLLAWLAPLHALFELPSNFRMQLLFVSFLTALAAVAFRRWRWALATGVVLAINLFYVFPYWTPSADAVTQAPTAEILQYNIYFGNDDFEGIAATINDSDAAVVGIHELTNSQWDGLEPLLNRYPHRVVVPVSDEIGELGGGMALLSRRPIVEVRVASPSNTRERPILAIETEVAGTSMTIIGLHPHASRFSGAKVDLRTQQLDAVIDTARAATTPVLVLTDMNITPFSPEYKRFLNELEWRDPHKIAGWNATWPAFGGAFGTPIDHIFVSNDVALHGYETGDGSGSDHLTVTATISVPERR